MADVEQTGDAFSVTVRLFVGFGRQRRALVRGRLREARSREDLTEAQRERVPIYLAALDYADKIDGEYGGTWMGGASARVVPIRLPRVALPHPRTISNPRGTTRAHRPVRRRHSARSRAPSSRDSSEPPPSASAVGLSTRKAS